MLVVQRAFHASPRHPLWNWLGITSRVAKRNVGKWRRRAQ